jgi:hypothetical protein
MNKHILTLLLLFIIACTPKFVVYNSGNNIQVKNESAVLYVDPVISIYQTGLLENLHGKHLKDSLLREYICLKLERCIADSSEFMSVHSGMQPDSLNTRNVVLKYKTETLNFKVSVLSDFRDASQKYQMYVKNIKVIYALTLQAGMFESAIARGLSTNFGSSMLLYPILPKQPISLSSDFLIWNKEKMEAVRWGKIHCYINSGISETIEAWDNAIAQLAGKIVEDSPFEKKVDLKKNGSDSAKTTQEIKKGKVTFKKLNKK